MTQGEIVKELRKLNSAERLKVVQAALRLIEEDLQQGQRRAARSGRERQLAAAAKALFPDYAAGGELTAFTSLDGEDFHAQR